MIPDRGFSPFLTVPERASSQFSSSDGSGTATERNNRDTASKYRLQAAALMAQIKDDMKGQKRIFSGETEASYVSTRRGDDDTVASRHSLHENKENQQQPQPHRGPPQLRCWTLNCSGHTSSSPPLAASAAMRWTYTGTCRQQRQGQEANATQ